MVTTTVFAADEEAIGAVSVSHHALACQVPIDPKAKAAKIPSDPLRIKFITSTTGD